MPARRVGASDIVVARIPARIRRRTGQYQLGPPGPFVPPAYNPPVSSASSFTPYEPPAANPFAPVPPEHDTPFNRPTKPPCNPIGGNDVMVAGEVTITAAEAGGNDEIVFNFAGSFCPRVLYLVDGTGTALVTGLLIGAKNYVIGGNIPATIFAPSAEGCCPIFSIGCVCGPGIPLTLKLRATANGTVRAVMFGEYCEACPPP